MNTIKLPTTLRISCAAIYYPFKSWTKKTQVAKNWHKLHTFEPSISRFPSIGFFQTQEADRSLDFTVLIRTAPELSLYVTIMSISCIKWMDESITMLISPYKENSTSILPCHVDACRLQQQSLYVVGPAYPNCGPHRNQYGQVGK